MGIIGACVQGESRVKKIIFFLMATMAGTLSAHAYTGFGICNYGKEIVPAVICYGPAVLKGTTVVGGMKVAGPLKAINVMSGPIAVTGSADLQNSKIKGPATITGSLKATGVSFQQGLVITTDDILLTHSTVIGSVTVNSQTKKPYLKMECGSTISGSVTFGGMAGVIQITDDSIVQGKVINGSMEFVKKKCS